MIAALGFDDGHELDQAVSERLSELGVPGTFYLIANRIPRLDLSWYKEHEIASHSQTHPHMQRLKADSLDAETSASRDALERWSGRRVSGFAYPYGQTSLAAVESVFESGYEWARMFCVDPENAYLLPEPMLCPITGWLQRSENDVLAFARRSGRPIHVCGHSYGYDTAAKLDQLTEFIRALLLLGYVFVTTSEYISQCRRDNP